MTNQPNQTEQPQNDPAQSVEDGETLQTDADTQEAAVEGQEVQEEVKEKLSPMEELQQQVNDLNDRWLRSQAELDNVRRRARRDVEEKLKFANTGIVSDLLEVVENLDRAMEAGGTGGAGDQQLEGLLSGVKMVSLQFTEVLKKHGCVKIDSTGQVFDPNIHEAVQMVPNDAANGTIVQELRSGYKLHERVVRPAQVIVSSGPAA